MTPDALLQAQFAALLAEAIGQLERFARLLEDEHEMLLAAQVDTLLTLADDKTESVRQLQQSENARVMLLGRAGIDARAGQMPRFVETLPESGKKAWARYLELAHNVQTMNQRNGTFIRDQLRASQQAMAVLLANSGPVLYDADGLSSARPGGRLFGQA